MTNNSTNSVHQQELHLNSLGGAIVRGNEQGAPQDEMYIDQIINRYENPFAGWENKYTRGFIRNEYFEWIYKFAEWKNFVTLTFRDEIFPDVAHKRFKYLIRELNKDLYGKRYTNLYKHCYFSYCLGVEFQKRDVLHFHFIADKPLNFKLIHKVWGSYNGFVWIDRIDKGDIEKIVNYVTKYITKGGEVLPFRQQFERTPAPMPAWWRE